MLSVVIDSLFIVAPIVCDALCLVIVLLFSTLCHSSSVAITLMEKRELVALL